MAINVQSVFGALGIEDSDEVLLNTYGQEHIFENVNRIANEMNTTISQFESLFVEGTTSKHKWVMDLTTGGEMEKITNLTQPKATKVGGQYEVALPLEEWGTKLAWDRTAIAKMSAKKFGRNVAAIMNANIRLHRREILRPLFDNAPAAFWDETFGSLTLVPLANGDTQLYPPVVESDTPATANHFIVTGYAASSISDSNDPYPAPMLALENHWGLTATGSRIVSFINQAQVAKTKLLAAFIERENRYETLGNTVTVASNLPENLPGITIGSYDGLMPIVRWDRIPANYILTLHLDAPPPLMKRVEDPKYNLPGPGLVFRQERHDEPLFDSWWSDKFGMGVVNRLSAVVTYLATGSTYVVPARFLLA